MTRAGLIALLALACACDAVRRDRPDGGDWDGWGTGDGGDGDAGEDGGADAAAGAAPPEPSAATATLAVRMDYTVDGDTVQVVPTGGDAFRVRVWGINTPEVDEPFYQDAKDHTRNMLPSGQNVTLGFDRQECAAAVAPPSCRDNYNRVLAYIAAPDGKDLGAALMWRGLARIYAYCNCSRLNFYRTLEAEAQRQHLGIWSQ